MSPINTSDLWEVLCDTWNNLPAEKRSGPVQLGELVFCSKIT